MKRRLIVLALTLLFLLCSRTGTSARAGDTGACCFPDGSCLVLTGDECLAQGGSYQGDESVCDPSPCPPAGACCFTDGSCLILTVDECDSQGGGYQGDGSSCDQLTCANAVGGCCISGQPCQNLPRDQCLAAGGTWQITYCENAVCPGACCLEDGSCVLLTPAECEATGGDYQGDETVCDPSPCPVPDLESSWGFIKSRYRQ